MAERVYLARLDCLRDWPEDINAFLDGRLPYTGLALWFVLLAALAVVACGRILR
jgi:hypothetical protein